MKGMAALMKKPWVWVVELIVGVPGLVHISDVFFLFVK